MVEAEKALEGNPERDFYDVSLFKCQDDYSEITFYISLFPERNARERRRVKLI